MAYAPRPHISHALQHLRTGVYSSGAVLAIALLVQVFCFVVIHFGATDTKRLEPEPGQGQADVVHAEPRSTAEQDEGLRPPPPAVELEEASINEVPSSAGLLTQRVADVSQIVGIVASVALIFFMAQGVAVAGGGGVPGVEMVVTSSTWAFALCALALPWSGVLPEVTYEGVLRSGEGFALGAQAHQDGETSGAAYYGVRLILPLVMIGGACACVIRFRAGVRKGIIVTHASMLDEQLEEELRRRKVGEGMTPRAVGALNSAIGESAPAPQQPAPHPAPAPPPPMVAPPQPAPVAPLSAQYGPEAADPGSPKRPI